MYSLASDGENWALITQGSDSVENDIVGVRVGPDGSMLTSPDIRAGMAMLIAACCAEGESVIKNAQVIDRGYEAIEDRLSARGADIVRED